MDFSTTRNCTLSNDVKFCCASQGLNKFSFWLKAIAASLVQIKKQCWIVKRIFSDSLQKKCPFSNFFFLFRNQGTVFAIPKCNNLATLIDLAYLTPNLCSLKVKVDRTFAELLYISKMKFQTIKLKVCINRFSNV